MDFYLSMSQDAYPGKFSSVGLCVQVFNNTGCYFPTVQMYVNQRVNTAVCVFEEAASSTVSVPITISESFARSSVSSLSTVPRL